MNTSDTNNSRKIIIVNKRNIYRKMINEEEQTTLLFTL